MKSLGTWRKARAQATYTFPAHMSAFVGKLPQTMGGEDYYDSVAIRREAGAAYSKRMKEFWRLDNPEAPRPARTAVAGENIIDGFRREGYVTIGTGAMSWFNPSLPAGRYLTEPFERYAYFDGPNHAAHMSAAKQVAFVEEELQKAGDRPAFVFVNFGETHYRFEYEGCDWQGEPGPYGDTELCLSRQRACLEHLDGHLRRLMGAVGVCDAVLFSDHGEALGEDGLWGHGFGHDTVLDVPMLMLLDGKDAA